jgi:Cu2+-exporting ATPase
MLALILATGLLYPGFGIELNATIAAGAMSLSSISVILNSMKIRAAKFS